MIDLQCVSVLILCAHGRKVSHFEVSHQRNHAQPDSEEHGAREDVSEQVDAPGVVRDENTATLQVVWPRGQVILKPLHKC